jgi:hypothetical protein
MAERNETSERIGPQPTVTQAVPGPPAGRLGLRERGFTLCLCNTNHQAGPRIRKQDPWELEGHGQYVPPVRYGFKSRAP